VDGLRGKVFRNLLSVKLTWNYFMQLGRDNTPSRMRVFLARYIYTKDLGIPDANIMSLGSGALQ
jgi:hypothetical protein